MEQLESERSSCQVVSLSNLPHFTALMSLLAATKLRYQQGHEALRHAAASPGCHHTQSIVLIGSFSKLPCRSRTRTPSSLSSTSASLCLLVQPTHTPSFTLKDSVIFCCHMLYTSHLHSSMYTRLISNYYLCASVSQQSVIKC